MSNLKPLRAGVIGGGVFGRFHAQKYAATSGVRLIGVADMDGARAADAAAAHGAGSFTRIEELLENVDVVSIATPASTHAPIALAALAAGKHVYVEKPIATAVSDADRMIAAATAGRLILQTGHQERLVLGATGLVAAGAVPKSIECVRAGPYNGRAKDVSVVLDLMIHDIDLAQWLAGATVQSVSAVERAGPGGPSDEVEADIVLTNGCKVNLLASRMASDRRRAFRAVYPDGEVTIDFLNRTIGNTTPRPLVALTRNGEPAAPEIADSVGGAVQRFLAAVRGEAPVLIPPVDARNALDTANRILAAAKRV